MDDETIFPASDDSVRSALAYYLTHDTTGKTHRKAGEIMSAIVADFLLIGLKKSNFIIMQGKPTPQHSTHSGPLSKNYTGGSHAKVSSSDET